MFGAPVGQARRDLAVAGEEPARFHLDPARGDEIVEVNGISFRNLSRHEVKTIFGHTGFTGVAMGFIPDLDFAAVMLTNRLHTKSEPPKTDELWLPFLESSLSKI